MAHSKDWLKQEVVRLGPQCREYSLAGKSIPLLEEQGVEFLGVSSLSRGYRCIRPSNAFVQTVGIAAGRMAVYVDGRWRVFGRGTVILIPFGEIQAFRYPAKGTKRLRLCWVCHNYHRGPTATQQLTICRGDAVSGYHMISSLYWEFMHGGDQETVWHLCKSAVRWSERMHEQHGSGALCAIWRKVGRTLHELWDDERLAGEAKISEATLRRICHNTLGRGPMHHVTYLRMHRAAAMVKTTSRKLGDIALSVGYTDPFAFSVAFKRVMGISPSHYRSEGPSSARPGNG